MNTLTLSGSVYVIPTEFTEITEEYNTALVLSQIYHYLKNGKSGRVIDGVRWIYNSYKSWCDEFTRLTPSKVRRIMNQLRESGIIIVQQLTKKADDKNCYWYTLDYERIQELLSQGTEATKSTQKTTSKKKTRPVSSDALPSVTEDTACVIADNFSIYTDLSTNRSPIENNITEPAAESFLGEEEIDYQEEEETPTPLASNPSQHVTSEIVDDLNNREDKGASSARYHNNVLNLQLFGIALNKQLEKLAAKYSEKEVERSLEYMEERIDAGKTITNKAGWLTDCLKDEWWRQSSKSMEEALILEGLSEMGYSLNNPEAFFDEMWLMVGEGFIDPMPTDRWSIEGLVGNYLQIMDGITYVNWSDWSWQKKLDQNIFQSMALTEAKERFYGER